YESHPRRPPRPAREIAVKLIVGVGASHDFAVALQRAGAAQASEMPYRFASFLSGSCGPARDRVGAGGSHQPQSCNGGDVSYMALRLRSHNRNLQSLPRGAHMTLVDRRTRLIWPSLESWRRAFDFEKANSTSQEQAHA